MITRLKVSGFKNLVDLDVSFSPFTCIAGLNGVGKSNLFDAIRFLSATASMTLFDASCRVRDESGRHADIRSLFTRVSGRSAPTMSFEVEMICPREAVDDLGAEARATANFLCYKLVLRHREQGGNGHRIDGFEIEEERLTHIQKRKAADNLAFVDQHEHKSWLSSILHIEHRAAPFISTDFEGDGRRTIKVHQDGGSRGRPQTLAGNLPRTVLSISNAAESPTALCARRELESWMLLQLEPAFLRRPDDISAPRALSHEGEHLPGTLYEMASEARSRAASPKLADAAEAKVYASVVNRLRELIAGVRALRVDHDEKRDTLTIEATDEHGTTHPAKALSDGTLRFLALAVLEQDAAGPKVICLEEPENGIHPSRIPAMLRLLQDIAADVTLEADVTNPPRQVIINTHSPIVVRCVRDEDLLFAKATEYRGEERGIGRKIQLLPISKTWRTRTTSETVAKGDLLAYLSSRLPEAAETLALQSGGRLVGQREDLQEMTQMSLAL